MLATITHILPLTIVRRERVLPVEGKVVVRRGQKVAPKDVVAEASLTPKHLLLDIARGLGLPAEKCDDLIERKAGEEVSEGDVIAGPVGIARRVVRAPAPGRIVLVGEGQVLVELDSDPFELRAGLSGTVVELLAGRGVVVEATGALIQAVWGNGGMDFGLVQIKIQEPGDMFTVDDIDVSLRGTIVLGGYCEDDRVLQNAADIPLRGLILSSMSASLVPLASRLRFPIVVLEGFGYRPMDSIVYDLIMSNQSREVSVNAEVYDSYRDTKPEIVIPLPASSPPRPPVEIADFIPGQKVRCVRPPYAAMVGTLDSISSKQIAFPNGIQAVGAEVSLEGGDRVMIPLANLELIA